MIIRPACANDAAAIVAIWNRVIRETTQTFTTIEKTTPEIAEMIATQPVHVAEIDAAVKGFGTFGAFRPGPGYAQTAEHTIYVAPDAQGLGAGRALLREIEAAARADGRSTLVAGIGGENGNAVAFHSHHGFEIVGRLPAVGRKFERSQDLVLMVKKL